MSAIDDYTFARHLLDVDPTTWARHLALYGHVTRRAQLRARRARNRIRRAWLLEIGRERRRLVRLDPPFDYDEIPF